MPISFRIQAAWGNDLLRRLLVSVLVLGLAGCTTPIIKDTDAPAGPEYMSWLPKSYTSIPENQRLPVPQEKWWEAYESQELNVLVERALATNFDLKAAVARISQSYALADSVKALQAPTLDAFVGAQNQAPWNGVATAPSTDEWSDKSTFQFGLRVNYEVDLWGKKGFNTDSAYQKAISSKYNRDAVALSLVADVTDAYFTAVSLIERIKVGERNLESIAHVGRSISIRVQKGDATAIELQQQLILQRNTEANLALLRQQRDREISRLAFLLGTSPSTIKIQADSVENIKPVHVEPGMPSDLLCRRPDVRRAEANLMSAQADLYAARANLFPTFNLSGQAGYGSYFLGTLTSPQSLFFNITANLVQSIFDGGRRRADIMAADAKNYELLEQYAATVVAALRDVEEALSNIEQSDKRFESLDKSRKLAESLSSNTRKVFTRGAIDFVQLLQIEQTVLAAEDTAIAAKRNQLKASIDLIKAIGGGVKPGNDPCLGGGKLPEAAPNRLPAAENAKSPA